MAEPLLTDVFGAGATQDATHVHILKADLAITASATNRAEQLFAGVVKKAASALTSTTFGTNIDQSVSIAAGFDQLVYRQVAGANTPFLQSQLAVNFAKPQVSAGVTPDDY
jgi:hypothetical protein